jgi:flagellar basal body-associated protein FliL
MAKVSKPILIVMVLALVAAVGALVTVMAVTLFKGPAATTESPSGLSATTSGATGEESTTGRAATSSSAGSKSAETTTADRRTWDSARVETGVPATEAPRIVGDNPRVRGTPGREAGKRPASRVDALPASRKAHSFPLDDGQKAAIAEFEKGLQASLDVTFQHDDQAMKDAYRGLEEAMRTGNEQMKEQARSQLMELARHAGEITDRFNQEYLDGVRSYLTPEQVAEMEKIVKQKTPSFVGYSTTTDADGNVKVEPVDSSNVTVHSSTSDEP